MSESRQCRRRNEINEMSRQVSVAHIVQVEKKHGMQGLSGEWLEHSSCASCSNHLSRLQALEFSCAMSDFRSRLEVSAVKIYACV